MSVRVNTGLESHCHGGTAVSEIKSAVTKTSQGASIFTTVTAVMMTGHCFVIWKISTLFPLLHQKAF